MTGGVVANDNSGEMRGCNYATPSDESARHGRIDDMPLHPWYSWSIRSERPFDILLILLYGSNASSKIKA